jgi:hypothetical protein
MKNTFSLLYLIALLSGFSYYQNAAAAPQIFSGTGASAITAFDTFKTAIKTATGVDGNRIGWDGVKLDGTDVNPNTRVIDSGKTVEIPVDRFKNVGAIFADPYTVSGDGFASVNPGTANQFVAFSPSNVFAMFDPIAGQFDDRNIQQSFVLSGTDTVAGTRGFGAIFVDVEQDGSSSIEYFGKDASNNKVSLGKYYVTPSANGEAQFLGVLFDSAVVAEIEITVGSKALFSFDGSAIQAFGAENLSQNIDLAVTDDFFFPVPETLQTSIAQTTADCLFSWAETNYPGYFSPSGAVTQRYTPYIYRYYSNTNSYLGVSAINNDVYYLTPYGELIDVGDSSYWLALANCL